MKVDHDPARRAQVYAIEAAGDNLTEAVCNGLDQACQAVERITEWTRSAETSADYHVIDITLSCPAADLLRAEAKTYWAQAQPDLQRFFPMNSLVFWAAVAKLPALEPEFGQTAQVVFARIAALNAGMEYSQIRSSDAYLLGAFEAMTLAAANRHYVPWYICLLRHWDMSHETPEQ